MIDATFLPKYGILIKFGSLKYQQKLAIAINSLALTCDHRILQNFQSVEPMAPNLLETLQKMANYSCHMHLAP